MDLFRSLRLGRLDDHSRHDQPDPGHHPLPRTETGTSQLSVTTEKLVDRDFVSTTMVHIQAYVGELVANQGRMPAGDTQRRCTKALGHLISFCHRDKGGGSRGSLEFNVAHQDLLIEYKLDELVFTTVKGHDTECASNCTPSQDRWLPTTCTPLTSSLPTAGIPAVAIRSGTESQIYARVHPPRQSARLGRGERLEKHVRFFMNIVKGLDQGTVIRQAQEREKGKGKEQEEKEKQKDAKSKGADDSKSKTTGGGPRVTISSKSNVMDRYCGNKRVQLLRYLIVGSGDCIASHQDAVFKVLQEDEAMIFPTKVDGGDVLIQVPLAHGGSGGFMHFVKFVGMATSD